MCDLVPSWSRRVLALLERLAERPVTLACVLLAANAVAQPYTGLSHDAGLYAAQVTERVHPGSFKEDLYLRYDSQDRYSVFTRVAAPLVATIGLPSGFFLGYLASKALFFWGAMRLVGALVRNRAVMALSLLHVALIPMPFGGNEIFHVNESFLTPRLCACALVFLGLERMLAGRSATALGLMAGTLFLHPLMAFPGLLVFLGYSLANRLTRSQLAWLLGAGGVLACMILAHHPLGNRLFGRIDDDWREIIFQSCYFIMPSRWTWGDWMRIAWSTIVLSAAASGFARSSSTFLLTVLGVALLGLIGSLVAVHSHYLLLNQGSPYRALWLLEFLATPLTFGWALDLWEHSTPARRCSALAVLLLATGEWSIDIYPALAVFAGCMLPFIVYYRGLAAVPRRRDWLGPSSLRGVAITVILLTFHDLRILISLSQVKFRINHDLHPVKILEQATVHMYKLPLLLVLIFLVGWFLAWMGQGRRSRLALLTLWAGYQLTLTWAAQSDWYGRRFTRSYPGRYFVTAFLQERETGRQRSLTLYWHTLLQDLWFDAHANSYFNLVQMSGCSFNRGTALDGRRRAELVRLFEVESLRRVPFPPLVETAGTMLLPGRGKQPASRCSGTLAALRGEGAGFHHPRDRHR